MNGDSTRPTATVKRRSRDTMQYEKEAVKRSDARSQRVQDPKRTARERASKSTHAALVVRLQHVVHGRLGQLQVQPLRVICPQHLARRATASNSKAATDDEDPREKIKGKRESGGWFEASRQGAENVQRFAQARHDAKLREGPHDALLQRPTQHLRARCPPLYLEGLLVEVRVALGGVLHLGLELVLRSNKQTTHQQSTSELQLKSGKKDANRHAPV